MKFNRKMMLVILTVCFLVSTTLFACTAKEQVYEPTQIVLSYTENELSLNVGETFTVVVADNVHFKNGINYSSSDDKIATISSNGEIAAVAAGSCVITVTSGDLKKELNVTVTMPSDYYIVLDRLNSKVGTGSEIDVTAKVYANGALTEEVAQWSVDVTDTNKVELTTNGNTVVVRAKEAGKYLLTATAKGVSSSIEIEAVDGAYVTDYEAIQTPVVVADKNYADVEGFDYWKDVNKTVKYNGGIEFIPKKDGVNNPLTLDARFVNVGKKKFAKMNVIFEHSVSSGITVDVYKDAAMTEKVFTAENVISGDAITIPTYLFSNSANSAVFVFDGVSDGSKIKVQSLSFNTINYATSEYLSLWSADYERTPVGGSSGVTLSFYKDAERPSLYFSPEKIKEMADDGCNAIEFRAYNSGFSFWFNAYGGKDPTKKLLTNKIYDSGTAFTLELSDLLDAASGEYFLRLQPAGWWQSSHSFSIADFCFVSVKLAEEIRQESLQKAITANISTADYDWAANSAAECAWIANGTKSFDGGVKVNCNGKTGALTLDSNLITAAIDAGYDTVKFTVEKVGNYDFWLKVYNNAANTKTLNTVSKLTTNSKELSFNLSALKYNEEYSLYITTAGWDQSDHYLKVTSLKFIDSESIRKAALSTLITAKISDSTYDWAANEAALCAWKSSGAKSFAEGVKSNCKDVLTLDPTLLKAAAEQGYDSITISAKNVGNYQFWFKIYKGETSDCNGDTNKVDVKQICKTATEGSVTETYNLSQLKEAASDNWYMHVSSAGSSSSGHYMVITSLKFSKTNA